MRNFKEINRTFTVKKNLFLKRVLWLMIPLLTLFTINAWGTTANFSYSDLHGQGASGSGAAFTGASKGSITMSGVGNGNSSYVQIYANGTLTFTPLSGATITGITITATSSTYARAWSASSGSVSVNNETITWTGSSTSTITLTNTESSQARLTDMVVTYTIGTTYDVKWYVGGVVVEHEIASEPVVIVPDDVDDGDLGGSCSSYAFMGWSETNIGSTPTNTRPADLFFDAPIINENKEYYAVFADCSGENAWEITSIDQLTSGTGYTPYNGTHTASGISYTSYQVMEQSSLIQFQSNAGFMYNTTPFSNPITRIAITTSSSNWGVYVSSSTISSTPGSGALPHSAVGNKLTFWVASANQKYFHIKGGDATPTASSIKVYYGEIVDYRTECVSCANIVTLATNSPTNGSVTFSPAGPLGTCDGDVNVTMTIAPSTGYYLSAFNVSAGSVSRKSEGSVTIPGNSSQNVALTFAGGANGTYTANATFAAKEVTGWVWKQETPGPTEITIPAIVNLYVGQQAWFNLKEYTPSDVIADKKGYSDSYSSTYLAQDAKAGTYYKTRAKAETASTTLTFTSSSNSSVTQVITIRINALPSVTFTDIVHGETFSAVVATVDETDKRIVYTTKQTPTHADISDPGSSYNACEREHLHLVGWIDSEWADANLDATHAEIVAATAYFYAPNADIDLISKNGKIFYAVWGKENE